MRHMLEAGVHFGHRTRYWNPKMAPYIYGIRQKIHIINLEKTLPLFQRALGFIGKIVSGRGKILFVGTKFPARGIVREEATRCGMPYVDYHWLGGMLTNYKTIRQSIKRLGELEERLQKDNIQHLTGMTKKEILRLVCEKERLSAHLSGIKNMGSLPDSLFVIDVGHEKIAVQEANRLGIPVVGVVDTNENPENINYIIPGNDDAVLAIRLYCKAIACTIINTYTALNLEKKENGEREKSNTGTVTKSIKEKTDLTLNIKEKNKIKMENSRNTEER
nr:30S ribosomal protein S2 [Coxiella endosymbiont of Amblyomma sculptum]